MTTTLLNQLLISIRGHRDALDVAAKRFRTQKQLDSANRWNRDHWCHSVFGDSLVKLRIFTENNFNFVETLGVISVSRYIFELSVWLKLFNLNPGYGLVYYGQLIDTQLRYWKDYHAQLKREIDLLRKFGEEESSLLRKKIEDLNSIPDEQQRAQAAASVLKLVQAGIDEEASRHFSIYSEQAKTNGYEYQAHLIEEKALPEVEDSIASLEQEATTFKSLIPDEIKELTPNRWNWSQMAGKVGLSDEYSYIYTFSSKLLHATPASITTNHKNLEIQEMIIFLKFIDVKIRDLLELSQSYA